MNVLNHLLFLDADTQAEFRKTPNVSKNRTIAPEYLIIHYTAGSSLGSSVNWLTNPAAEASAHLVIGRDGKIVQLARFNQRTWHAGRSQWRDRTSLNSYSIGIELDNAGKMTDSAAGWAADFGTIYPDEDVVEAVHKHETVERGWHRYTPEQIDAVTEVAAVLCRRYGLKDVLGHDDIAPGRKLDPGPAFPLEAVRDRALGREADEPEIVEARTALNLRDGPGVDFDKLPESPLAPGTKLNVKSSLGVWLAVEVLKDDKPIATGWVHSGYVR